MTPLLIAALIAIAVAALVWAHRRDLRRLRVPPTVEDPRLSASAGGFGPELDDWVCCAEVLADRDRDARAAAYVKRHGLGGVVDTMVDRAMDIHREGFTL